MQTKPVYHVGDCVIIRDHGEQLTTYDSWFAKNHIAIDIAARYQYYRDFKSVGIRNGDKATVVAVGVRQPGDTVLAVEVNGHHDRVWLIGARGVEPETKTFNVRISIPMQIRAKSFDEVNDIARFYLAGKVSVPMSDMEVYEE